MEGSVFLWFDESVGWRVGAVVVWAVVSVSELLESGKTMFKELSNEFEERLIDIQKEQIEKWQEEIKELRLPDSANEETNCILQN
ncbi:hypothetical protein Tsubulata_041826, partial [Turnera subulata]